ncbi:zinc ABC transporter substrate-binding protein [Halorhodospira abdelmalekii]|uniref:zinc ABC transporter substrate-binding protein ZnuA n=1 Tax=Halorhodospira abdelmalekii TaxID=421629 RepID=UPI001905CF97|nr:zinc ABC transporter substrate-binding protein ZnuA [Halorhodospira abdelmalekii]MBK1735641.1 zinc ABC transporter substrate-binding protein [Halorhodospira abdelmalekii]
MISRAQSENRPSVTVHADRQPSPRPGRRRRTGRRCTALLLLFILWLASTGALGALPAAISGAGLSAVATAHAAPTSAEESTSPPQVVVSIKPLHALTAGVMAGVAEPYLLLAAGDSPHTYAMRPSAARAVRNADLVVYISPHFERFLESALEARRSGDRRSDELAVATIDAITLHSGQREHAVDLAHSAGDSAHDHGDKHGHDHDHHHDHERDYHLWLDPHNAKAITRALAERLAELDPEHAERYQANAAAQQRRLAELDERLRERLEPIGDRPFVVFHDAYQYFERRYDLAALGAVTLDPERQPGARHLRELRAQLAEHEAVCLFSEPQFRPATVDALARGLDVRTGELDPLGAGLEPGPQMYFTLLERLADALIDCLADGTDG